MSDDAAIREYLSAGPDTFWQWGEESEVLVWKDGKTIAFRDELRTILDWLAPQGLPSLHSIALVLAATHDSWGEYGGERGILAGMFSQASAEHLSLLCDVLSGLDRVHQFDRDLRTAIKSKCVLVEMVLESCHIDAEPHAAKVIVEALQLGVGELIDDSAVNIQLRGYATLLLARDMRAILQGLQRVSAEAIRLRTATSLESLPQVAELDLPPSEAALSLINALLDDREYAGLARVTKRLLPLTLLPRSLSLDQQLEQGGFSDIANRGSVERLLISELANDDLTLAVRVAMNEALYLRREAPPSAPHVHRAILIDVGIRSWGVPRVFATAAALAFAAGTPAGGSVACYRARKTRAEPGELFTRSGMVEHLAALETALHPAEALPSFLEQIPDTAERAEIIVLLPEDALRDPAMQTALRQLDVPKLFVATVNRNGLFRLSEHGRHGGKVLREADIDIDDLIHDSSRVIDEKSATRLPAIFNAEPFPLLLSHNIENDRAWFEEDYGAITVTRDQRLMRWESWGQGALQLTDQVPPGKLLWVAPTLIDDHLTVIVGGAVRASLLHISREAGIVQLLPLRLKNRSAAIFAHRNAVFQAHSTGVDVLSMHTGEVITSLALPAGLKWVRDRFFCSKAGSDWCAISFDGQTARLERVASVVKIHPMPPLITMFERPGKDGPIGVTRRGELFSTATGHFHRFDHKLRGELHVPWIAADGRRLQITGVRDVGSLVHDRILLKTETMAYLPARYDMADDRIDQITSQVNLRHRFHDVGLDTSGRLVLRTSKGTSFRFDVRQGLPVLNAGPVEKQLRAARKFEPLDAGERGYKLWQAVYPDGSRFVLDSRGLLHLMSADPAIPETTIVLAEGELSGWCADGRMWGKPYFVGKGKVHSAVEQLAIYKATVRACVEHIDA